MNSYSHIRTRFWMFTSFIFFMIIIFWVKSFFIQVIDHHKYKKWKKEKYLRKTIVEAPRGAIYDRNGKLLAQNILYYELYCEPLKLERKKEKTIRFLKSIFKQDFPRIEKKLQKKGTVLLSKNVTVEKAKKIQEFREKNKVAFLFLKPYYKRIYPYQSYAGQVIGFVNYKNEGVSGIELKYNSNLKGQDGYHFINVTPKWVAWENVDIKGKKPIPGDDIYLTIDLELQAIAEEELAKAVKKYKAKGGMVVMMNTKTAEVLAIASIPKFDPNHPGEYKSYARKNRSITDIFEPGSIFKPIVAAALFQKGKLSLDSLVYCENGAYKVYKTVFHDHKKYGWLTFKKVLANSSNIGMIKMTMNYLKNRELYNFLKMMGFGQKTNIDLPGETGGILHAPNKWSGITKATLSFGHGIGVTALQMANAYIAIANGGKLMKPYLVKKISSPNHKTLLENKPKVLNEVFSEKVSHDIKTALLNAVEEGTGVAARIENLAIAGKTGTAQKVNSRGSGYSRSNYVASFIGFFPVYNPELVILVMLDSPQAPHHTGGNSAAPTFKKIVQEIIGLPTFAKLVEQNKEFHSTIFVPDLSGYTVDEAKRILKELGVQYKIEGKGNYILDQSKKAEKISPDAKIILKTSNYSEKISKMPDLKGKSLKEVLLIMNRLQIPFYVTGHGKVVKQYPNAGTDLKKVNQVKIICRVS